MKWLVLVRPEAERDMVAARDWYEGKRMGLGGEFLEALASGICVLEQPPERQPLYFRNFRRVLLQRFPYKIFYQVIGQRVVVFRVLHAKQEHNRGLG